MDRRDREARPESSFSGRRLTPAALLLVGEPAGLTVVSLGPWARVHVMDVRHVFRWRLGGTGLRRLLCRW